MGISRPPDRFKRDPLEEYLGETSLRVMVLGKPAIISSFLTRFQNVKIRLSAGPKSQVVLSLQ
jgi:hypothetical protein